MQKISIEEYFLSKRKQTDLFHVLDLIRENKWFEKEIIEQLIELYRAKKILFSYHGTFFVGHIISWSDSDWIEAQEKGTSLNSMLRANYRLGFKKKELIKIRYIMRMIKRELPEVKLDHGFIIYYKKGVR